MDVKVAARETLKLCENMLPGVAAIVYKLDDSFTERPKASRQHIENMLNDIAEGNITGEKAHRWLGWAQCAIYCSSELPLEAFKEINHAA